MNEKKIENALAVLRGMSKRGLKLRLEQKFAVLDACMLQLNLTHLMYQTNMNCLVLKEFTKELLEKGLLTEKAVGKGSVFKTSAAGYELLKQWRRLAAVVEV